MLSTLTGYSQDTVVVSDLRHGWMELTRDGKTTPVQRETEPEVIIFEVGKLAVEPLYLRLSSTEKPVDIWFEDKLLFHHFDSTIYLRADTLVADRFKVFARQGIPESFQTTLVTLKNLETEFDPISEKEYDFSSERYLITATLLLLMGGIFRRYFSITFNQSFRNPLTYKIRSISVDQTYVNFGSMDNLYSIFFFGVIISFLLRYLDFHMTLIPGEHFIIQLLNWLLVGLVVSVVVLVKFMLTKLLSALFQFKEVPNIQIQDFIHFFTLVATATAMISFLDFSLFENGSAFLTESARYLMVIAVLFFQFWLFFKLDKFYAVRKLVIISYLCTTEFLPGFLTVYWLMKM